METNLFWMVPAASLIALFMAWYFYRGMMKESEGTDLMKKIAGYVRKGAMSYLKQQYRIGFPWHSLPEVSFPVLPATLA